MIADMPRSILGGFLPWHDPAVQERSSRCLIQKLGCPQCIIRPPGAPLLPQLFPRPYFPFPTVIWLTTSLINHKFEIQAHKSLIVATGASNYIRVYGNASLMDSLSLRGSFSHLLLAFVRVGLPAFLALDLRHQPLVFLLIGGVLRLLHS